MTWNDATGTNAGDSVGLTASVEQEEAGAEPGASGGIVSLRADVSAGLLASMQAFIERHPNWDQYRLVQAALAGFLVQNGSSSRDVTRCYLANLFPGQRSFSPVTAAPRQQQP
jgi:hypothetical protein